ncbi:hypothetical protein CAPTEDRAFT_187067 [Capitella teleta]|uniref:Uncharacterized protein n=1 Tax=Capitella teleta TaxID=283909 RepID=R7TWU6_CAPTE|nr:hypothetical protein CAPTEDRAFT_187067 [Capitella teleta]|eukprot:ELT95445.1 hypothetical protein CAPTEDRAFT_187067 [Capitella teleta]
MKGESKGGVADALRMYKQKMTLVCEDNEVTEPAAIVRKIKIGLGDEGLRRLNASGLTEQQLQTPTAIWQFLERNLQNIQRALLNMRATPLDSKIPSPAELLMGRRITTSLPYHDTPNHLDEEIRQRLQEKRESQKINHDQRAGPELPPLHAGQAVSVMDTRTGTWEDGSVKKLTNKPRLYIVETPRGTLRRNRKHLREAPQAHVPSTSMTSANGKIDDHLSTPSAEPSSAATDQAAQTTAETKADTPSPGQFVTRSCRTSKPPQRLTYEHRTSSISIFVCFAIFLYSLY